MRPLLLAVAMAACVPANEGDEQSPPLQGPIAVECTPSTYTISYEGGRKTEEAYWTALVPIEASFDRAPPRAVLCDAMLDPGQPLNCPAFATCKWDRVEALDRQDCITAELEFTPGKSGYRADCGTSVRRTSALGEVSESFWLRKTLYVWTGEQTAVTPHIP
jgi:hypothetical protein